MNKKQDVENAFKRLTKESVAYIRFEMSDLMGVPRSKTVPIGAFESFATKGVNIYGGTIGFDSASNVVPGTGLGEEKGYCDSFMIPDLSTLTILPWDRRSATVICNPHPGGELPPMEQAPRQVLLAQLQKADNLGFSVKSGHELEFYLFDAETQKPLFEGSHIFLSGRNHYTTFITELMDQLTQMGFKLTTHNAEYAPSQFEINFAPLSGIEGADRAFQFKAVVKEFAQKNGLLASFMSKPKNDMAGNGYHLHIGLNHKNDGSNAFNDPKGPEGLSDTALHFTAGIMKHTPALTAIMAPTINCYHRFLRGSFAPSRITWGIEDRTALLRMKASGDAATHLELRGGAGMANPYLLQAATLAAGLLGIEQKLQPQMPKEGLAEDDTSAPELPQSLSEALQLLEDDQELSQALGSAFIRLFVTVKKFEIDRCARHISDWEQSEYLELY